MTKPQEIIKKELIQTAQVIYFYPAGLMRNIYSFNADHIIERVKSLGIKTTAVHLIKEVELLEKIARSGFNDSSLMILIGGGGKNTEKIIKKIVAKITGRKLVLNHVVSRENLKTTGESSGNGGISCLIPQHSVILPDPEKGTPGFIVEHNSKIFLCLPNGSSIQFPLLLEQGLSWVKEHSVKNKIKDRSAEYLYKEGKKNLEEVVAGLLQKHHQTIATAESCTGGLIADRLTDVPGSSCYFVQGVVVYSNQAKQQILGVKEETLQNFGAVSEQVVQEMCIGMKRLSGADLVLAVSGIAGPGGGSPAKPVGLVYIGLYDGQKITTKNFLFQGFRRQIKLQSSQMALDLVRRYYL